MPELPHIEVWKLRLEQTILDLPVREVAVCAPEMVEGCSARAVVRALTGAKFKSIERRGKFTILRTNRPDHLILHLGMSGRLEVDKGTLMPDHIRLLIHFSGGLRLSYTNERKFGLIKIARNPMAVGGIKSLGPDPLDEALTAERFRGLLAARRRTLKPLLMDQRFLAGLGNVYTDEILFQSGIRPDRRASELSPAESDRLYETMQKVLRESIRLEADPSRMPARWLLPRHEEDEADCPACGLPLVHTSFGKRAATFCRKCQK